MERTKNLQRLNEEYDLCVIGGGASGVGCALDATLRGLKVLLVEKEDFAAETSSKSTKLIHGGVRYLERAFLKLEFGQFRQVKHGLEERHILLRNAPHLARPLGLITPVFSWFEGLFFNIGLTIYGWFASGKDNLPKAKWLTKKQAQERITNLTDRAHSAVMYYDGQFDDARFCFGLAQAASEAGAVVLNHASLADFSKKIKDGTIATATIKDELTSNLYEITAKTFLNCTGADFVRQKANSGLKSRIQPSKGVHLTMPLSALGSEKDALLIPETPDGRVVFAIPFEGKMILGTTDDAYSDLKREPVLDDKEIDYLLETLAPYVKRVPSKHEVQAGFGGLRPLIKADPSDSTKSLVRDHEVEHDKTSGLFSLLGGKWTTYRLMAEDAVDAICAYLGNGAPCTTDVHYLPGGAHFSENTAVELQKDYALDADIAHHLASKYGDRADRVAVFTKTFPTDKNRLIEDFPYINAEVHYAARHEMACTPRDILARRMRLELLDWKACEKAVPMVAAILAYELDKDEAWEKVAVEGYQKTLAHFSKAIQSV